MALTHGCHHVAVITEDMDRFLDFYVSVFDATVKWDLREDGIRDAVVDLGAGSALHPFQLPEINIHARGSAEMFNRGHLDHVALNVTDSETFEELRRRLVERGATDGMVTDFGVARSVWFEDPDGHGCEIAMWVDAPPRKFSERGQEPYVAVGA
jgi:catechol 2,3-dioxygenase-like lactoylglutathione lyase family enzyme